GARRSSRAGWGSRPDATDPSRASKPPIWWCSPRRWPELRSELQREHPAELRPEHPAGQLRAVGGEELRAGIAQGGAGGLAQLLADRLGEIGQHARSQARPEGVEGGVLDAVRLGQADHVDAGDLV